MAEIKSTLDIIMKRLVTWSLCREGKQQLERAEQFRKISGYLRNNSITAATWTLSWENSPPCRKSIVKPSGRSG